ncbi:SMP-30/gluconolactonase/LRE family protein [Chengkuizengella axinellae]|uniref:SMP-30/gluconolactonase/LRE family protein n=1 Tax=Chengkuizengella axinellae TaxID=3064388 RepID=A0ABT9J4R0_9BACL|nr:SMP-30/gluconolactonase/LRE family protein [Chengkuizengella sp. 2205SS18-9]MDP5276592.1 SMP-30/gluconolactonase/LRE family protein [Chengkuizengella sp. 2205SS18-9]
MNQVQLIVDSKSLLGEGPCWDEQKQCLYWVDILQEKLHIYDPKEESNTTIQLDQAPGAVVKRSSGGLVLAMLDGFFAYDLHTNQFTQIIDPESHLPENRFNDGKCDPAGRFWAGTMRLDLKNDLAALYCLDTNLSVRKMIHPVSTSNGLAWSQDHKTMYYIDTPTQQVVAYDYSIESGEITNKKVAVEIPAAEGGPDGMTIDAEGKLWVAHWGGYKVSRWDPQTGKQIDEIKVPAKQVTSCTFGGDNLDELFITTANVGLESVELEKFPHSGGLFSIKTNIKGTQSYEFIG